MRTAATTTMMMIRPRRCLLTTALQSATTTKTVSSLLWEKRAIMSVLPTLQQHRQLHTTALVQHQQQQRSLYRLIIMSRHGGDTTTTTTPPLTAWGRMTQPLMTITASSHYRYMSSAREKKTIFPQAAKSVTVVLPPNLKFDPRSSFASQFLVPAVEGTASSENVDSLQRQQQRHRERKDRSSDVRPSEPNHETAEEHGEYDEDDSVDSDVVPPIYVPKDVVFAKPLPQRLNVEIHTLFDHPSSSDASSSSSLCGTITLDETVFGCDPIRVDIIKRAVEYYRHKTRGRRKAVTKTIGQVSGSGRKIRKQKGGGVARAGHSRPPHFRGGAKAHGPKNVTDYGTIKLNKKVRHLAIRHVLSQKLKEGNLILLNQMYDLPTHKTNDLVRLLLPWNIGGKQGHSALLLDYYHYQEPSDDHHRDDDPIPTALSHAGVPTNLHVAALNIPNFTVSNSTNGMNVYRILQHEKLILTLSALAQLEQRYKQ